MGYSPYVLQDVLYILAFFRELKPALLLSSDGRDLCCKSFVAQFAEKFTLGEASFPENRINWVCPPSDRTMAIKPICTSEK